MPPRVLVSGPKPCGGNIPSRCHNPKRHDGLFVANGLIQRSCNKYFQFKILCQSRAPPCNHASVIAPQFAFNYFLHVASSVLPVIVDHRPKTCEPKT